MLSSLATPTRTCADCGHLKPWTEYHAKTKWDDGTTRCPSSYCKPCASARRAAHKRNRPDLAKAQRRRQWTKTRQRLRTDPEFEADYREEKRFHSEAYRRRQGMKQRPHRQAARVSQTVDTAPFAAWLDLLVAEVGSVSVAADACSMTPRKVWAIRSGTDKRVELATVDAALQAEGRMHLSELYDLKGAAI